MKKPDKSNGPKSTLQIVFFDLSIVPSQFNGDWCISQQLVIQNKQPDSTSQSIFLTERCNLMIFTSHIPSLRFNIKNLDQSSSFVILMKAKLPSLENYGLWYPIKEVLKNTFLILGLNVSIMIIRQVSIFSISSTATHINIYRLSGLVVKQGIKNQEEVLDSFQFFYSSKSEISSNQQSLTSNLISSFSSIVQQYSMFRSVGSAKNLQPSYSIV
ncbi:unnamed protein product (macronuclear) [Paramecium tetraurelia]|uniref:Transmembrane protein n=1 Tax=Paramecium tetraurelia TaxID=5888 RepID=A0DFV9_PARTE|nr:uncharacterized protein GSPATT00039488001 [Paramecium tetraurelia]CAK81926.1 unnamed protein product [Paramecium tetraurelia]|eukprot:XP_001449323.1 hypothetical protein (macronuclear) [Paramecium tetraurelia strain d4-2]